MKILILHQHFKSPETGGAIRSYYLAKALVSHGHRVVVITAHDGPRRHETLEGIEIHYLPIAYNNRFGFYKRIISFLKFMLQSGKTARLYRDFDYCYAISVPLTIGLAAMWAKRRYGIPYIFEVGDLWPEAPIQLGVISNPLLKVALRALEKKIYSDASAVVALSPAIATAIKNLVPGKAIHLIPNMADTDFYKPTQKSPVLIERFHAAGKFVVSYIGALGLANGLDYFLESARAAQKANLPILFILCGDGAMAAHLKNMTEKLHLNNLRFVPFLNRDGVKDVMNITDAVFICYKPLAVLETGSPNKFFDGLAAGKLIIINFGGWIKEEIETNLCGVALNPNQPSEFSNLLAPYLASQEVLSEAQKNARALAERKYSRTSLSEQFVALFIKR